MTYAWQKFHSAAAMLRNSDNHRDTLPEAFAHEISHINDVDTLDMPVRFRERIVAVSDKFSLPENVETITCMGHPHQAVKSMSDDEIQDMVREIYELEKDLNDILL